MHWAHTALRLPPGNACGYTAASGAAAATSMGTNRYVSRVQVLVLDNTQSQGCAKK